jgi:cysteine-S-conjugate beta-lyase
LPALTWHPPQATFLAWLDCRGIGGGDAARQLFLDRGVALEPGSRFGTAGSQFVRLNFATSAEILDRAVSAMAGSDT